jgi:hypothetical protein
MPIFWLKKSDVPGNPRKRKGEKNLSQPLEAQHSLMFELEVDDGWPPVAVESLPFKIKENGFLLLNPPLFIKGLSVGDDISVTIDDRVLA